MTTNLTTRDTDAITTTTDGPLTAQPAPGSWLRRLLRDDDQRNPWHVLFIRWVKHERIIGTNIFTDHTWLPKDIPYFPSFRHHFEQQQLPSGRPIVAVLRDLFARQGEHCDPVEAYYNFEQAIFRSRADLDNFLFRDPSAFVVAACVEWALTKENVLRRIALKGADNDPFSTIYNKQAITNEGDLVINPFTVSFDDWRAWAENRLLYDFVRGVETQILKLSRRREFYRRLLACTWRPIDHDQLTDALVMEAVRRTLKVGSIRAVKLLKSAAVPGKLEIELPIPFDLLYQLIARFRPMDLKRPFTRVFYPVISTVLGPGVKLGTLNMLDYFGVRWKCPCFWTGTSLFRVDRTILW